MQTKTVKNSIRRAIISVAAAVICTIGAYAQNTMIREHHSARKLVTNSILNERIGHLCDSLCEGRGSGQRGGGLSAIWLREDRTDENERRICPRGTAQ